MMFRCGATIGDATFGPPGLSNSDRGARSERCARQVPQIKRRETQGSLGECWDGDGHASREQVLACTPTQGPSVPYAVVNLFATETADRWPLDLSC
jgi:hypothetical protein